MTCSCRFSVQVVAMARLFILVAMAAVAFAGAASAQSCLWADNKCLSNVEALIDLASKTATQPLDV
jgi:hypothetical protein